VAAGGRSTKQATRQTDYIATSSGEIFDKSRPYRVPTAAHDNRNALWEELNLFTENLRAGVRRKEAVRKVSRVAGDPRRYEHGGRIVMGSCTHK
jgi:hypothetical protein